MLINFICSKDFDEIRTMRTKCNNVEIMMGNETYESIKELFESLAQITTRIIKFEEVNLFLMVLIFYIKILIKKV